MKPEPSLPQSTRVHKSAGQPPPPADGNPRAVPILHLRPVLATRQPLPADALLPGA
jgi:hypothetical protein